MCFIPTQGMRSTLSPCDNPVCTLGWSAADQTQKCVHASGWSGSKKGMWQWVPRGCCSSAAPVSDKRWGPNWYATYCINATSWDNKHRKLLSRYYYILHYLHFKTCSLLLVGTKVLIPLNAAFTSSLPRCEEKTIFFLGILMING